VTLILELISPPPTAGGASRQTFHGDGGSIGRESDNSWVLPHSKVSGHHAVISYRNSVYYIEDRSRNGVCLNSSRNRLERGRPYALTSGDRILIEPYEIRVTIAENRNDAAARNFGELADLHSSSALLDPSSPFDTDDPFGPRPIPLAGLDSPVEQVEGQPLDPLELLNLVPKQAPARKALSAKDLERGSPLDQHYKPPAVVPVPAPGPESPANANTIPRDYDPLAPDDAPFVSPPLSPTAPQPEQRAAYRWQEERVTPRPISPGPAIAPAPPIAPGAPIAPVPRVATPPPSSPAENSPPVAERTPVEGNASPPGAADFATVLAGAGLDPANISDEIARDFGAILRVVVSGVMDVMRSRQQIKDEFRMRMTRVRAAENNPLKFSANVDDALHNLLVKRNPAYLPPVEAFEDAFADLRNHQIAMLAGMRVAFESMLAEFDPDRLQQEFDRQLNKGLVPAKLRYWDLFRERRQDIVKDPEASFRRLFGEEFARAYEDQLKQLKAQEGSAPKAPARPPKLPDR
jgi:predicted component of type VI protein secretion system